MDNNAVPKPLLAEIIPFAPDLTWEQEAKLDDFANNLDMVPDDILLAYVSTRYTKPQILQMYDR